MGAKTSFITRVSRAFENCGAVAEIRGARQPTIHVPTVICNPSVNEMEAPQVQRQDRRTTAPCANTVRPSMPLWLGTAMFATYPFAV